jgi:hypothetical protein
MRRNLTMKPVYKKEIGSSQLGLQTAIELVHDVCILSIIIEIFLPKLHFVTRL